MKKFVAEDLFLHHTLTKLKGSSRHGRLVFAVGRALREADSYERTLWVLDAGDDEPRRLTSTVFTASSPNFNADGSVLAFLSKRGKEGKQVHLLDMDGGEARQLTNAKDVQISTVEGWSPDGRRLLVSASVKWKEDGEQAPPDGARPPSVARFLPYKRDGAGIIVAERTHLFSVDAESGELSEVTEGDFDVSFGAWSPDGTRLSYTRNRTARQRHRRDVWVSDADGSNARMLVDTLASVSDAAWSPDGRWLAIIGSEEEGDSMTSLWLADSDTGELRLLGGEDFEVDPAGGVRWHPDGDRLLAVSPHHSLLELAVVRVPEGEVTRLPLGLRHVLTTACWGERIAFVSASMRKAEEIYSIDWNGGDERRHTRFNRDWFAERVRPRVRKRRMAVPDGEGGQEKIDVWVLAPPAGEGPFPVLVDMHGGPHSGVLIDYSAHTYWYELCSQGWVIVAPNAVGSDGFGKAFARRLRGKWGKLDLPQYEAVIRQLQDEGLIDDRIVCTGKSYGGFLSAWAATHSDLFKAAIVCAPVANIESHFGTSDTGFYVTPYDMGGEFHSMRALYEELSPVTHCLNVDAAVLILQGENDGRCPRGQAEELFANLIRCTDAPVELVVYPTSTHSEAESGRPSNRVDYHTRIPRWAMRWTADERR